MRDVKNGIEIVLIREKPMRAVHAIVAPGAERHHVEERLADLVLETEWSVDFNAGWGETDKEPFYISRWMGDAGRPDEKKIPYGSWVVVHKGKVKVYDEYDFKQRFEVDV